MHTPRIWMCLPLLLMLAAGPTTKLVEERGPAGNVEARYSVLLNGTRDGPFTTFYADGKTKETGNYNNGQLEGSCTAFYPNGKISLRRSYHAGALDGPAVTFDEAGRQTASTDYRAGKRHGVSRTSQGEKFISEQVFIDDNLIYPRSPSIMARGLAEIRKTKIQMVAAEGPLPTHKGEVPADRDAAVRLVMEYRYLCFVPPELALDARYNAHDEAAATILAQLGKLSHDPSNPGWPEADFQFAHTGCASSNIYMGSALATAAVRSFMFDSDRSNIDRVGHRRWCLNPVMGKTGFGAAGNYVAMWSIDKSRQEVPDYDFVAYPAPGYFPTTHFDSAAAWSISLNPKKYALPDKAGVKVTVKPAQVSQSPLGIHTGEALYLNDLNVSSAGAGIPNAIIFRPERCNTNPGNAYLVEITGLKTADNEPAPLKYLVEFCRVGN
ncbi:MAG: hypothetical protein WCI73_04850 [Phycisphaerae bacterium]